MLKSVRSDSCVVFGENLTEVLDIGITDKTLNNCKVVTTEPIATSHVCIFYFDI